MDSINNGKRISEENLYKECYLCELNHKIHPVVNYTISSKVAKKVLSKGFDVYKEREM